MVNSYKEVQEIALQKLSEFEQQHLDKDNALDIVTFAEKQGFIVLEMPLSESGLIIISDSLQENFKTKKLIIINERDFALRKRFTIAHELGHYFLRLQDEELQGKHIALRNEKLNGIYKSQEEKYADYFASILLMPGKKVLKLYEDRIDSGKSVRLYDMATAMSKEFLVSKPAAVVRLRQLGMCENE